MLSENERDGCLQFLQDFQKHELLSLVDTVTNHMITVQSKQEAIKAIIFHSESAQGLLGRKRVKKEYIFRHLAAENVSASPTADKQTLVRQLLSHWGTAVPELHGPRHLDETEEDCVQKSSCHDECSRQPPTGVSTIQEPSHVQELAQQFASWFYQQLNSFNKVVTYSTTNEWGSHHFWEDSKLNLCITSSDERRKEIFQGAELIAQRFQSFVCEEGLIFNPNISPEGTQGLDEPHGLVRVRACGTVHRGNDCMGLFEQQFGLIRDPLKENNWKIKFTDVNMKQATVKQMPTLRAATDMPLAAIV